jgi:FK506-binding protein 6
MVKDLDPMDDQDYEVQAGLEAVQDGMARVTKPISLKQLKDGGAEFEVEHLSNQESDELKADQEETDNGWWTEEQLLAQMENREKNPIFSTDSDGDKFVDFTSLKTKMTVIYDDKEDRPLIWKMILSHGHGDQVVDNSCVGYHSTMFLDGSNEPFDCSRSRKRPFLNRLNHELIVPGLRLVLTTMRVGEEAVVILDPSVAFGEYGCPPRIPPNQEILYQVEVLKLYLEGTIGNFLTLDPTAQSVYSFEQLVEMADLERKAGNSYFAQKRYRDAGIRYKRAIQVLENRPVQNKEQEIISNALLLKLYVNTANTQNKLPDRNYATMTYCRKALGIDKNNVKAHYFYGKAKMNVQDYEAASTYLSRAADLKPGNIEIVDALIVLNEKMKKSKETSDELAKKMAQAFLK